MLLITVNVIKGEETKSVKVSDDVYDIYVKSGVSTVYINFKIISEKDVIVSGANSIGNDSSDSPPTGDNILYAICLGLLVAFSGIVVSGYFKKRYNLFFYLVYLLYYQAFRIKYYPLQYTML